MKISRFRICIMLTLVSLSIFSASTFAAGTIRRDGLRLELLLATGSQDTSGNGRIVSSTGVVPTYQVDSIYGVPFAQFTGSGGFKVNTAWTASGSDDFTVSMWTKVNQSVFDAQYAGYFGYNTGLCFPEKCVTYAPVRFPTSLFVALSGEKDATGLHLTLNNNGKCALRSAYEMQRMLTYQWGTTGYEDLPLTLSELNSNGAVRSGIFTAMQDQFDCTALKDNKWHNIIIRKQSGKIELLLDEKSIGKINSTATISRVISIGNLSSFSMDQGIYGHLTQDVQKKILNNHFYRGGISSLRIYSRSVTDDEVSTLNDEFRYSQGDLTGASGIQVAMDKYFTPNLSFYLKGVPLNLSKENVIYQYSVGSGSFVNIDPSNLAIASSSTGFVDYKVNLNLSSISDGKMSITLRVKNGELYQNIGTIGFVKNDAIYNININQPDITNTQSKIISATTNSGGTLYFFLTRGSICDSSITTWDDYTDLIFTSKSDNFTRVCYRAVFSSVNKTIYKISDPIQGISPLNQFTTTSNLFADYSLWVKSAFPKPNDSALMILELLGVSSAQSQGTINGITMTDINGDGLVDFLYSRSDSIRRAIIINNGNYTFKTVYKCAVDAFSTGSTYYGDCADSTR